MRLKILLTTLLILVGIVSAHIFSTQAAKLIEVNNPFQTLTPVPTATPQPWTLEQKIAEAKAMLKNLNLTVGLEDIKYSETRIGTDPATGKITISTKDFKEPEREMALVLLNKETGSLEKIVIKKRGLELIAPAGYEIQVVKRLSGIGWNFWNTQFHVEKPKNTVVIANAYPDIKKERIVNKQKVREIENVIYAPYSPDAAALVTHDEGGQYIKKIIDTAFETLKQRGVTVSPYLDKTFFAKLPLLEQSDYGEFLINPKVTTDRVKYLIFANGAEAFGKTCNSSKACGWIQFTPGTYNSIRKTYPAAKLIPDFKIGAADHLNSMMAAILLHDYNLKGLVKKHGAGIAKDSRLEEYLAASYNGSPVWVTKSLRAYIHQGADWLGHLRRETKGFIGKLRIIKSANLI